jgi:hypothetical protein
VKITRTVILGFAKGHSVAELRPFIVSLRRTGYKGDVVLFIEDLTSEAIKLLDDHGVQLHSFPNRHFRENPRHLFRAATRMLPPEERRRADIALAPYYLHMIDARWPVYANYLRVMRGLHSHVMFSDVRDVIFQRDPFDFEWKAAFCSFAEAPGFLNKDHPLNRKWIRRAFGEKELQKIGDKRIVCNGVIFAETAAAQEFADLMSEHVIRVNSRDLVDQGVLNYLVHHNLLRSHHIYEWDETSVLHLALVKAGDAEFNKEGLAVNGSGHIANVVHQYVNHRPFLKPSVDSY